MKTEQVIVPETGHLVQVRGQQWVVTQVRRSRLPEDEIAATRIPGRTLVTLASVSDEDLGDELTVVWEIEPGRDVIPATQLPAVTETGWDDPQVLGAFLDAVRWGTVASADTTTLQAPFRSGISIEEYQLEPVARALRMPRVNLLIADDVGLGKTIEAGLVMQEMLLRHRARRIIVVCPAPLTIKWREEMAEKFGLDFTVLSAATLRDLRRSHGLQANPFTVFPRTIISLPWLRTPRVQRLLDEVLTGQAQRQGFFDLLIVDEAHHCAPPAPRRGKGYAVDSLQTRAVRRLGEHSQHRLFLSATPHNGYSESWQALLEILDPQRFARGVEPDKAAIDQIMVRRLKDTLTKPDGSPRFPGRSTRAIEVTYTDAERHGHDLLTRYLASRRRTAAARASGDADRTRGNDLVALLLKKRLFSSPAAFASTLEAHAASVTDDRRPRGGGRSRASSGPELPDWFEDVMAWDEALVDDESGAEAERELFDRVAAVEPTATDDEIGLLTDLRQWAQRHAAPADSKAKALIAELDRICRPGGDWAAGERVIVFTEYVDTQVWLTGLLQARGLGGDRLGLLHGGMDERRREHLKAAFQAAPDRDPVRILLATDAASEGIDLQRHCHRVIHYDVPFNPNRLEQRIGRVDRHGQRQPVDVAHFVGSGWQQAEAGSQEADLEFLARVAVKVATERADLGSVNPVLASAVEARMLGRPVLVDPTMVTAKPGTQLIRAERDLREQAQRLRAQLQASTHRLHVSPPNVRRVVDVALQLAGQPPLVEAGPKEPGVIAPPLLRSGWERTVVDLADPLTGEPRSLTFDSALADDREDVVLAHLEHPLVAHSTRLLRSAIWGGRTALHRVAAVRADLPPGTDVDGPLLAVFARLVVVGADGSRLHEEVMLTGRVLPADRARGRSRRLDLEAPKNAAVREAVEASLDPGACDPAPGSARARVADEWEGLKGPLAEDVRVRARERVASLTRALTRRAEEDSHRVNGVFDQLEAMLSGALAGDGVQQLSFDDLLVEERKQWERDRLAWEARLEALPAERERELASTTARYAGVRELVFPFAVALVVARDAS